MQLKCIYTVFTGMFYKKAEGGGSQPIATDNVMSLSRVAEVHPGSLFPAKRQMFQTRLACNLKDARKGSPKYLFKNVSH